MKSTHTEFNLESKAVNPLESNRSLFTTSFNKIPFLIARVLSA